MPCVSASPNGSKRIWYCEFMFSSGTSSTPGLHFAGMHLNCFLKWSMCRTPQCIGPSMDGSWKWEFFTILTFFNKNPTFPGIFELGTGGRNRGDLSKQRPGQMFQSVSMCRTPQWPCFETSAHDAAWTNRTNHKPPRKTPKVRCFYCKGFKFLVAATKIQSTYIELDFSGFFDSKTVFRCT